MSTRKHIVGNMVREIDLKFSQAGKAWGTFSVATNDGKDEKKTECFTECKVFGDMAESIAESLAKGTRVIVEGREQTEKWESNGENRSRNVLIVDAIGPDLRYATAKVTRTQRQAAGGFGGQDASPAPSDPWASAPATDSAPF